MPEWLNDAALGIHDQQLKIFMKEDRNRYAVFETQDSQYHIIKTADEVSSVENGIDAWKEEIEMIILLPAYVLQDGSAAKLIFNIIDGPYKDSSIIMLYQDQKKEALEKAD